jgi:DNA-binding response OmpR family regulator
MNSEKLRVLVVDDEARYVRALKLILNSLGYEVIGALDGPSALEIAASEDLALVLLDLRMPKMDGLEVCRKIREYSMVPIIMVTALAQKSSVVKGLEAGADDYLTKPFSTDELVARVNAVLRRASVHPHPTTRQPNFHTGALEIIYTRCEVWIGGKPIHLTPTEFRLLCELSYVAGCVVSPAMLLEKIWGSGYEGEEQMVARVIHRLRQKVEPIPAEPTYILTRPGLGYMLEMFE